jgi:GNAT superfamily N-acetyltransferase
MTFEPLAPARWKDFEMLFGAKGACGGCWCMWWRLKRSEWVRNKGEKNRRAMKRIVESNQVPGIIAYDRGEPVGWCSIAPRETFPVLERSRSLKPIDDRPVWSIACLFVRRDYRGRGVSIKLIHAASRYAKKQGGRLVEAYPEIARAGRMPDAFAWTGLLPAYLQAGFKECAAPSATRRIVRLPL